MEGNLEKKVQDPGRKTYTHEEAVADSIKYFKGDDLAATVFVNKYALKDSFGNIYESSPEEMHKRITEEIFRIEQKYPNSLSEDKIYSLLKDFKYIIPQGSPMSGIGNNYQIVSLSNCFVIGNDGFSDSYGGIMKIDQEQVQLMKRRGGVGHDLSHIRPKGSNVLNSALTATGIVPFMERYSNSTREVAQDGRRGALMLSISIKHPDAERFIDAKLEKGKVTGANISVRVDDEFMMAVRDDKKYIQQYPVDSENPTFTKEIAARDLWNKIVHNAWKSAEPGVLFWDTIIRESIPDCYADLGYKTVSTNPCGEIPLCPYDSCRLLAINLKNYVKSPFTKEANFDFQLFKEHAGYAQRVMDDIIDLELEKVDAILDKIEKDPENPGLKRVEKELWENIRHKAKEGRRTGVGITAEGDMLAELGIKYGSEKGNAFSTELHKTLAIEAYRSSVNMAKERGKFEIYDAEREKDNPFIKRLREADEELYKEMVEHGRRNISLLTIAPTGTTSLVAQSTSGIEPVFLPVYKRRRKVNPNDKNVNIVFKDEVGDSWEEYNVFHHGFKEWLEINGYNFEEVKNYDQEKMNEIVKQSPYYQATSNDVDWVSKVKLQSAVQKWVDHSISVTINLPREASEELVDKLYQTAWGEGEGCKGVTVYREGSRSGVLISESEKKPFPKKRPAVLEAEVLQFNNEGEKWIAFMGLIEGKPYEIFTGKTDEEVLAVPKAVHKGKIIKVSEEDGTKHYDFQFIDSNGYKNTIGGISHQFNKVNWNYARFISGMLSGEQDILKIISVVSKLDEGIEGINTWKSGTIRALSKYVPDGTETEDICSDCGTNFHYEEGCKKCSCGSKCE